MPVVIPPAQQKTKGSAWVQFVNHWAKKYPSLRANAPDIEAAASEANIDPIWFASLLLTESGANYQVKDSSKGAIGIGQIMPLHVGESVPWDPTRTVTAADLRAPTFNLRWSAYYAAQQVGKYGYANAYGGDPTQSSGGYNHGAGNLPQSFIDKWNKQYIPKTTSTAPPSAVGPQAPGGTAPVAPDTTVRWAVLGKDGRIKFPSATGSVKPPPNVLTYGGTPLTQSTFIQTWRQNYADTYFAYTGHQASGKQIAAILKNAPSIYTLSTTLAQTPAFTNSPTYKAHAPGVIGVAKSLLGDDWKPDKALVAKAIAQNWDQATLEQNIKSLPAYEKGPAFQDTVQKFANVYTSIYGNGDTPEVKTAMSDLARKGWTPDEVAGWLRTQPEYKNSQEYKSRALNFAQNIGLITGQSPTLTLDQASLGGPPSVPQTVASNTGQTGVPLSVSGSYTQPRPAVRPDDRAGIRGA